MSTDVPIYLVKKKVDNKVIRYFGKYVGRKLGFDETHWALMIRKKYYHLKVMKRKDDGVRVPLLDTSDLSDKRASFKARSGKVVLATKIGTTELKHSQIMDQAESILETWASMNWNYHLFASNCQSFAKELRAAINGACEVEEFPGSDEEEDGDDGDEGVEENDDEDDGEEYDEEDDDKDDDEEDDDEKDDEYEQYEEDDGTINGAYEVEEFPGSDEEEDGDDGDEVVEENDDENDGEEHADEDDDEEDDEDDDEEDDEEEL